MDIETTAILSICAAAGITGAIACVVRHIGNERKHPDVDKIVYKDVCEEKMKGQEDCVESEIKGMKENIGRLETTVSEGFAELRKLIMKS